MTECKVCACRRKRDYRAANQEKIRARRRAWRVANKEKTRARSRAYYETNKERLLTTTEEQRVLTAGYWLQRKYGITLAEYDDMLESQAGGCAICGATPEENGKRLCVDHDHETDEVRGLLCNGCNVGLGRFLDNPALLRSAANYVEATQIFAANQAQNTEGLPGSGPKQDNPEEERPG